MPWERSAYARAKAGHDPSARHISTPLVGLQGLAGGPQEGKAAQRLPRAEGVILAALHPQSARKPLMPLPPGPDAQCCRNPSFHKWLEPPELLQGLQFTACRDEKIYLTLAVTMMDERLCALVGINHITKGIFNTTSIT